MIKYRPCGGEDYFWYSMVCFIIAIIFVSYVGDITQKGYDKKRKMYTDELSQLEEKKKFVASEETSHSSADIAELSLLSTRRFFVCLVKIQVLVILKLSTHQPLQQLVLPRK